MEKTGVLKKKNTFKTGVLKNFTNFTRKHLCFTLFNKSVAFRPATLLKKRVQHRFVPVKLQNF